MNNTKKILIILAIIFSFADAGWSVYDIVTYFTAAPEARPAVFYLVYSFILVALCITTAVLLIMCIWGNGKYFRQRYGLYMTALMLSIITNLMSITAILLIISMFTSDFVWKVPKDESLYHKPDYEIKSREEQIAELRQKKERGEITEEEFQAEILKLL